MLLCPYLFTKELLQGREEPLPEDSLHEHAVFGEPFAWRVSGIPSAKEHVPRLPSTSLSALRARMLLPPLLLRVYCTSTEYAGGTRMGRPSSAFLSDVVGFGSGQESTLRRSVSICERSAPGTRVAPHTRLENILRVPVNTSGPIRYDAHAWTTLATM